MSDPEETLEQRSRRVARASQELRAKLPDGGVDLGKAIVEALDRVAARSAEPKGSVASIVTKPHLILAKVGPEGLTEEQALNLCRKLTGREPTLAEIAELRAQQAKRRAKE